ncbi:hypothetical protein B0H34DRAFT_399146 [Crassisporium funariophilum]|nr:hypothetical protein B0H34DRAFT_399146 [Crassisporium funariophilum]
MKTTVDNTLGAMQVGSMMAVYLFGIVTLQAHHYYRRFRDDRKMFKYLVAAVWILELGHTVSVCAEAYRGTITYYGRRSKYTRFPALGAATLLGGLITFLVQAFFSLRVWKALPKPYNFIGLFVLTLASTRGVAAVILAWRAISAKHLAEYAVDWSWLIKTVLSLGAGIDIIIAVSMLYWLITKRDSAMTRVSLLIDRLVTYTVCTGLLTSLAAVTTLICHIVMPENFIWVAVYAFLAKLYSNSLLAALNEREGLRNTLANGSSIEHGSRIPRRDTVDPSRLAMGGYSQQAISIEMKTTTDILSDEKTQSDSNFVPQTPTSQYHKMGSHAV